MKNEDVKIICSAIYIKDMSKALIHQPFPLGYVLCGHRHHNIIELHCALTDKSIDAFSHVQGFLGSDGKFYNRREAMEIAIQNGQVEKEKLHNSSSGLFSEDLY